MHASGVQVHAAIELVRLLVKPHHGPPWKGRRWSPHFRHSASYVPASPLSIANLIGNAASTEAEAMMSIHLLQLTGAASRSIVLQRLRGGPGR